MNHKLLTLLILFTIIFFISGCEDNNNTNGNSIRTCQRIDDCKGGEVCNEKGECVRKELSNEPGVYTVECTNNRACPTGYICDLSSTNYGKCIKQTGSGDLGG
ncbi:MAG TPA: hypothetical protein VJH20_00675 [Candidatus Nanoarchaeia archaeon]|nr:hypothetical protein [Candidatus Nanoarchaeia archaeon]